MLDPIQISCPFCGAKIGTPCTQDGKFHDTRIYYATITKEKDNARLA